MPYTYTLTSIIPATPQEIYDAWLDSLAHSAMTGGEANMSDEIGAEVSAWDEYITGRNLELVPGERIVQSWRTADFSDEHADSTVTVMLEETDDGTLLTLIHSNVPDEHRSYEEGGWESRYFGPMRAYFAGIEREADEEPPESAAVTTGEKVRRAAGKRTKKAAPRPKVARGKRKTKRAVAAKAKRKSAKPRARKAAAAGRTAKKAKRAGRKRTRR